MTHWAKPRPIACDLSAIMAKGDNEETAHQDSSRTQVPSCSAGPHILGIA
jgi:hypothetical protein